MSDDPQLQNRVSAYINLCNQQLSEAPPQNVATSAAYAAARFSVFATATNCVLKDDLQLRRQHAIDTFVEGFRAMLNEHYDDFEANFDTYFPPKYGAITR